MPRRKKTPTSRAYANLSELGDRFIALGEALQDSNTTFEDLMVKAWLAGVQLNLSVAQRDLTTQEN